MDKKKISILIIFFIIVINIIHSNNSFSYNIEERKDDFFYNIFISSRFKTVHITVKNEKPITVDFLVIVKDGREYKRKLLSITPNSTEYFQFSEIQSVKINIIFFYTPKYDTISFIKITEIPFSL